MKERRYKVTVEGSGAFPIDMLRYDRAYPARESEVHKFTLDVMEEKRRVDVIALQVTGERWKSFGWNVVEYTAV